MKFMRTVFVKICFLLLVYNNLFTEISFGQQKMDSIAKQQVMSMLKNVKNAIKNDYYDSNFGGMDLEARFKAAEEKLKTTESLSQAFAIIAQAVIDLDDSHTRFYPPSRPAIVEYGWRMKVFGDKAIITGVKEKSDAETKGLLVGDEVLKLNGFRPTRKDMWKMIYYYQTINPQAKMMLEVRNPSGEIRQLEIVSKVTPLKAIVNLNNSIDRTDAIGEGDKLSSIYKHYFKELGGVIIWKMPDFLFDPYEVGGLIAKAKGKHTLILDLRGNPGGNVVTLEKLAGYFFEKDIKIADLKGRKPMDPQLAKSEGPGIFNGKVIVLIDASSASAAEIFARLMQLEKRGIVLGDISAGAVTQSKFVSFDAGTVNMISYGMNLTRADVIMSDGKSLEHVGVTPDEVIIPTGKDIFERSDPVMSRALELSGVKITPTEAGKFFPVEKFIERRSNLVFFREF